MASCWRLALAALLAAVAPAALCAQSPTGASVIAGTVEPALTPILAAYEAGRFAEACGLYRAAVPSQSGPGLAHLHNTGAIVLLACGATADAEAAIDSAATDLGSGAAPELREIVASNRALIIGRRGRWDEAARILEGIWAPPSTLDISGLI